jgi:hypothetical protein
LTVTSLIPAAHAALVSFSFSGIWGGTLGVIHAGDTFSRTATWDAAAIGTSVMSNK